MNLLNYIAGRKTGKASHRIEIAAMRDPFLADALEGYDKIKENHADTIAALQKQVSLRTKRRPIALWLISACSVAAVAAFAFYFVMQTPGHSVQTDNEELFVYIPENYIKQNEPSNINVEIENLTILVPEIIDVYVPDSYVEKKQFATYEAEDRVTDAVPVADIVNLNEFFAPVEPVEIYLPDSYRQRVSAEVNIIRVD